MKRKTLLIKSRRIEKQ